MKDSFLLFSDNLTVVNKLSDVEAGKLLKAIVNYTSNKSVDKLDKITEIVFEPIKNSIDRNNNKYSNEVEKRRQAGKLGGLASANKSKQVLASASDAERKLANQADSVPEPEPEPEPEHDKTQEQFITQTSLGFTLQQFLEDFNLIRKHFVANATGIKVVGDKTMRQFRAIVKAGANRESMQHALKAMFLDNHHRETRWKYCTPEFITRNDKFDRFSIAQIKKQTGKFYESVEKQRTDALHVSEQADRKIKAENIKLNFGVRYYDKKYGAGNWCRIKLRGEKEKKVLDMEDFTSSNNAFALEYPDLVGLLAPIR